MERINENTIRVLIGNDDLSARGITVLDLLGNHQQIESFFYSILEEVDTEHQFQNNDSVTFQVLPNRNGLELFISKNGLDEEEELDDDQEDESQRDDISEFLKRQLEQTDATERKTTVASDEVDTALNDAELEKSTTVIKLKDFESMVQIARLLTLENAATNLYQYRDQYYLEVIFFVNSTTPETIKDDLAIAYEYGEKTDISPDVLSEHGKMVMEQSALELTRYYFVK